MSEMVENMAGELRPEQIAALRKVDEAGPNGVRVSPISEAGTNPFGLLIIHRKFPGLLTGFSNDDDPSASRVTLTDLGRKVLSAASRRKAGIGAMTPNDADLAIYRAECDRVGDVQRTLPGPV